MEGVVLDNSVILAWCFSDEHSEYALGVMRSVLDVTPVVPAVWPLEIGNTLLVAERQKRIDAVQTTRILLELEGIQIQVEQEPPSRMLKEIFTLAREHQLSTYDASYLDLARRRGLPLATQDKSLRRAAGKCGVAVFKP